MPDILTFRLYAPLAAFGGVAVGEQRDGWDRPGRAAVMGMVAACLGIERDDEAAHLALDAEYRLGLLVLHVGPTMIDYHTAQMPRAPRGARRDVTYATRAAELAERDLNTVLSRRAYRSDALLLGALAAGPAARWTLAAIAAAMERPRFAPYAGRKSCALGLPLAPRVLAADGIEAALLARRADREEAALHEELLPRRLVMTPYLALEPGDAEPGRTQRTERRRDRLASRRRWQFHLRNEAVVTPPDLPCS